MALNTSKCNHLPPLPFKGLTTAYNILMTTRVEILVVVWSFQARITASGCVACDMGTEYDRASPTTWPSAFPCSRRSPQRPPARWTPWCPALLRRKMMPYWKTVTCASRSHVVALYCWPERRLSTETTRPPRQGHIDAWCWTNTENRVYEKPSCRYARNNTFSAPS